MRRLKAERRANFPPIVAKLVCARFGGTADGRAPKLGADERPISAPIART
jgi:hypothetical protein